MQTVTLDIDNIKSPKELAEILKSQHLQQGDSLVLKTDQQKELFILGILLLAIIKVSKKIRREKDGEELLNNLMAKYETAEELEKDIEKEYGINIEFETKNPIEKAFGLWKDYDIDAETLRKKAWGRKD
jgi:hypothetical protein